MERSKANQVKKPLGGQDRPPNSSRPHGCKLWAFRVAAMLVFGAVIIGALEGGLRLAGFGYPTRFFQPRVHQGQSVLVENPKFLWRFIPRNLARAPRPLMFPARKGPNTIRVFVLGESAAMGDPEPAYGPPRILETLLRARFPRREIEVINVAVTAVNSHTILPLARECSRLNGDFWLIYMGNNEVHGPFGPGTAFGRKTPNRKMLRLSLALQNARIGQLVEQIAATRSNDNSLAPSRGLDAFLDQEINPSDPRLQTVYQNFQQNLADIISIATRNRTKVVVSTVASNLRDFAPLGSTPPGELTAGQRRDWKQACEEGIEMMAKSPEQALTLLRSAEAMEPGHADLQFQLGTCLWHLENYEEASRHFTTAREKDTLRFRADSQINHLIQTTARDREEEGVYLIDLVRALEERSPHEVPGNEWFWDHVHFRFPGSYILARLAAEEISKQLPAAPDLSPDWLTINECAKRLGITKWSQHQLATTMLRRLERPPFSSQSNHQDRRLQLQREQQEHAAGLEDDAFDPQLKLYQEALKGAPADWNLHDLLGKYLEAFGDPEGAVQEWKTVIELMPHHFMARLQIGHRLSENQSTVAEAIPYLREAVSMRQYAAEVHHELAMAYAKLGDDEKAIPEFAAAIDLDRSQINSYVAWAVVLARMNKLDQAETRLQAALSLRPDSIPAHLNLANLLATQNKRERALLHYREVLRINPQHREALDAVRDLSPP